jgi:hypothetical protein
VKIAHDKEKTKRYFIYLASLVILALVGIYFAAKNGGTVSMNTKDGVSINLDKPIVAQVGVSTSDYKTDKGEIKFTTGSVSQGLIQNLESSGGAFSPAKFAGENFINKEAGFIFSISHPEQWQVSYNPQRSGRTWRINDFLAPDGSNLNVVIDFLSRPIDLAPYIQENIGQMMQMGMINQMPYVQYDQGSNTAFFYYRNLINGGDTYQKLILTPNAAYFASANSSPMTANPQIVSDMIQMVSTFTLIGK